MKITYISRLGCPKVPYCSSIVIILLIFCDINPSSWRTVAAKQIVEKVVEPDRTCKVSVTSSAQHLMTSQSSSNNLNCGSRHQPWKLEAPAGQQINVTLLEFGQETLTRNARGYILEEKTSRNISITSFQGQRHSPVLVSKSNSLQLFLNKNDGQPSNVTSYLIRLEAIGCSNIVPPRDAWLRRQGDTAIVGCYSSRKTWTLTCVNSQWTGVIGNCSLDIELLKAHDSSPVVKEEPNTASMEVVVIVTICVIGLLICAAVICVGVVCWKRYTSQFGKYMLHQNYTKTIHSTNGNLNGHQPLTSA